MAQLLPERTLFFVRRTRSSPKKQNQTNFSNLYVWGLFDPQGPPLGGGVCGGNYPSQCVCVCVCNAYLTSLDIFVVPRAGS
jgi:hypothetical protein